MRLAKLIRIFRALTPGTFGRRSSSAQVARLFRRLSASPRSSSCPGGTLKENRLPNEATERTPPRLRERLRQIVPAVSLRREYPLAAAHRNWLGG